MVNKLLRFTIAVFMVILQELGHSVKESKQIIDMIKEEEYD